MPQYTYKGRDKEGNLRSGDRSSLSADTLNAELNKEGIFPTEIQLTESKKTWMQTFLSFVQGEGLQLDELAVFARQMQLLHQSGVPIVTSLRQLASFTRSQRLSQALTEVIDHVEKGQSLSAAMAIYPKVFSPLVISIIQIGEKTGHLTEAFSHLHSYLAFESHNIKMTKASLRYPLFVIISIFLAIIMLNIFVIPTFSKFYSNIEVSLPWQTRFLFGMSNLFVEDGIYLLIFAIAFTVIIYRYLHTAKGKYKLDHIVLRLPVFGRLLKHLILIRFSQSLAIMLNSGVSVLQGLSLVKNLIGNTFIKDQISQAQEMIERGSPFNLAMSKVELFTPLENQIISVGEKNGELGPAMSYIGKFHTDDIEFELKRINDLIGPILISAISVLILIVALGIYLPVWNMINLVQH